MNWLYLFYAFTLGVVCAVTGVCIFLYEGAHAPKSKTELKIDFENRKENEIK